MMARPTRRLLSSDEKQRLIETTDWYNFPQDLVDSTEDKIMAKLRQKSNTPMSRLLIFAALLGAGAAVFVAGLLVHRDFVGCLG